MGTNFDLSKKKIETILSTADNDAINVCFAAYKIISSCESTYQARLFEYFCNLYGTIDSSEEMPVPKEISSQQLNVLKNNCADMIDGKLKSSIRRQYTEEKFYSVIWSYILSSSDFENEEERVFAFFWIVQDKRIPYFQLEGSLKMADEEFSLAQGKLLPSIQKIRFILATEFQQKTEKAYHLLKELDKYNDSPELRTVLMCRIISELDNKETAMLSALLRRRG